MSIDSPEPSDWERILGSANPIPEPPVTEASNYRFEYVPLQAPRDIRLFSLLPASSHEEPLLGGILHVSLDSFPTYETISYAWGDPMVCEAMQLRYLSSRTDTKGTEGQEAFETFYITKNLASALRNLRFPIVSRLLWIDAICINQTDPEERAQQVQLMASIYELAAQSIVWVGPEINDSAGTFRFMETYGNATSTAKSITDLMRKEDWDAWVSLFEARDLWNRIWVLQEIVLAPNPRIYCGRQVISWRSFSKFINIGGTLPHTTTKQAQAAWEHAELMNRQRQAFQAGWEKSHSGVHQQDDDFSLLQVLKECQTFSSSDQRDMLFAILNISFDTMGIVPNYRVSPADVWAAAFKVFMRRKQTLFLFHMDAFASPECHFSRVEGLPSWFVTPSRADDFFLCSSNGRPDTMWARDGEKPYMEEIGGASQSVGELTVMGVCLDKLGPDDNQIILLHNFLHYILDGDLSDKWPLERSIDDIIKRCSFGQEPEMLEAPLTRLGIGSIDMRSVQTTIQCSGGHACRLLQKYTNPTVCKYWRGITVKHLIGLKFTITEKGFETLLPPSAKEGDCLYRVHGDPTVIVLRRVHERPKIYFHVIGSAAVFGMNVGGRIPKKYYDRHHKQHKALKVEAPKPIVLI